MKRTRYFTCIAKSISESQSENIVPSPAALRLQSHGLTWKVAFTQVCTAAPEEPRMSGVISGLEDSWLPS